MTLFAELFERLDPAPLVGAQPQAGALVGAVENTAPQATAEPPETVAVEAASEQQRFVRTAATATPEWLAARDQYHGHIFACRHCHPPTGRYCQAGAALNATYDATLWS